MKTLKIFAVILLIVFLVGCETCEPVYLPTDLPIPEITGDDNQDIVSLIGQDVRWRIWASYARLIVGEITKEEHDRIRDELLALLE